MLSVVGSITISTLVSIVVSVLSIVGTRVVVLVSDVGIAASLLAVVLSVVSVVGSVSGIKLVAIVVTVLGSILTMGLVVLGAESDSHEGQEDSSGQETSHGVFVDDAEDLMLHQASSLLLYSRQ